MSNFKIAAAQVASVRGDIVRNIATHAAGANIYAAGVFLTAEWYATDAPRLAGYAVPYRMLILMANHAASIGTNTSVGKSAVWAPDGKLLAQAEGTENALIIATSHIAAWHGEVVRI